jgi:sugar lactone lactonase YvrE
VLTDDANGLVWICAVDVSTATPTTLGVRSYKMSDGSFQKNYPFPGPGFCNDLAFDANGNLFAADSFGKVLELKKGADAFVAWSSDPLLAPSSPSGFGADGIVVDGSTVYVNTATDGRLIKIPVKADGSADTAVEITVTPALEGPDGMRLIAPNTLMLVEGSAGRLTKVTVSGTTATATALSNRLDSPTSLVKSQGSWWISEGQLPYLLGAPGTPNLPFHVQRVLADTP